MVNLYVVLELLLIAEILSSHEKLISASKIIRLKRSAAIKDRNLLWNEGIIPYEIDGSFGGLHRKVVRQAMQKWEKSTCLRFIERNRNIHPDYLALTRQGSGCFTNVGKWKSGKNEVHLGEGCLDRRIVLHELGHAIGFHHEHNRPDRDQHVAININNVKNDSKYNFEKFSSEEITTLNQKYDYNSVMHYGRHELADDKSKDTIVPLRNENGEIEKIGKGQELSDTDIASTNLLYRCPECGKTLQDIQGKFGSVIDSSNSLPKKHCQWRITAARGEKIVLNITTLSILKSKDCMSDYLEIKDEYSAKNSLQARFCGKGKISRPIISSDSRMLVTYHANNFNEKYYGFTASYYKICGGDIDIADEDQSYYLESPNYPNPYEAHKKCVWRLIGPRNRKISMRFDYFKLEKSAYCRNDFLKIRNGENNYSPLVGTYCGRNSPGEVLSERNALFVKFFSNDKVERNGFSAVIKLVKD